MRRSVYILSFFLLFFTLQGYSQSVSDNGTITKREERFVLRHYGRNDNKSIRKDRRDVIKKKRLEKKIARKHRKMKRQIARNKRNWGTRESRRERRSNYKRMHGEKSWFAREHPRRHLKESMFP